MGIDSVDPHGNRLALLPPIVLLEGGNDVESGLHLVSRRHRVFEIEEDVVRLTLQRLPEHPRL
jgi:hypothetical protein